MTKPDIQRCWIIAILMLMFSFQIHEHIQSLPEDVVLSPTPVMIIGMLFGWVGVGLSLILTGATLAKLEPMVVRFMKKAKKEAGL
ncbi:MAG: hypothetical protein ACR2QF_00950 [Geminicoccaceae bacterium]